MRGRLPGAEGKSYGVMLDIVVLHAQVNAGLVDQAGRRSGYVDRTRKLRAQSTRYTLWCAAGAEAMATPRELSTAKSPVCPVTSARDGRPCWTLSKIRQRRR
jgi:hypothetical protein